MFLSWLMFLNCFYNSLKEDTSSLSVINTTESTSRCISEIWKVAVQKETVNSIHQAAKLQHQNTVKCLCFPRLLCKQCVKFWRLLKFSLVVWYVLGQGIVSIFSWWVKAVNICPASVQLWLDDIQHFMYSHAEVGRNFNCIYQVTITTFWVAAKALLVSVSRKVLEKPSNKKTPRTVTNLVSLFYTQMQKKRSWLCWEFSSWQSVQRSRESICQQNFLQIDHFFWSTGKFLSLSVRRNVREWWVLWISILWFFWDVLVSFDKLFLQWK